MMQHRDTTNKKHKGFTLVELMLSMTFVAMLILAIAYCIIQISNTYNKGLTMRQVNDTGRSLSDDLKRAIASSTGANTQTVTTPTGGRLCTGTYSYIWNNPDGLATSIASNPNRYNPSGLPTTVTEPRMRLARVVDRGGILCDNPNQLVTYSGSVDLLTSDDRSLALYALSAERIGATDTADGLTAYRVRFTLGTANSEAIAANTCRPPSDIAADTIYCAINEFSFTAPQTVR